eukprot:TRINITY_DN4488_c0_g1_i2.p1 TRINITY_DN4488_c0_g1~~TRINITY_DN4488_c0_g1_i2.p1  ORF type:complete len:1125 (-),score=320.58 TRINITY_DN4488_c0_g1_i2:19-3393(-)
MSLVSAKLSKEIKQIGLYQEAPLLSRLDFTPFAFLYVISTALCIQTEQDFGITSFVLCVVLFLQALTFLSSQWSIHFLCFARYKQVNSVAQAMWVKVVPVENKGKAELRLLHCEAPSDGGNHPEFFFYFQNRKVIYDADKKQFQTLDFPTHMNLGEYMDSKGYKDATLLRQAEKKFGPNKFDIPAPSFGVLYKEQMLAPFFVFQVFCVLLWCLDEYWYYSIFTLCLLLLFEATVVKSRLKNLEMLRGMGLAPSNITVHREGKWITTSSFNLLPGDLVCLSRGGATGDLVVPCDLLLLRGSCVVNEAMLTGESTPHLKEPIVNRNMKEQLNIKKDHLHVIYGGTKIIQQTPDPKMPNNLDGCLAYVLKTGFNTSQGKLMRVILFSTERITANTKETFLFIGFLLIFAVVASGYVLSEGLADQGRSRYKLLLHCTLIITSVVPPELPMELSLAVNTSLLALIRLGIYCTEPFRIPFGGKVDICCFDKTGTLTTDNLILKGVAGLKDDHDVTSPTEIPDEVAFTLAGCHSLVYVDNKVVGDPMETAAMKAINWTLSKGDVAVSAGAKQSVRIVHRYHFTSELKRMSTVGSLEHEKSASFYGFIKGAPEKLLEFYDKNTVPAHYEKTYKRFSRQGCRVLALGYKRLHAETYEQLRKFSREDVENGMTFAGFIIFDCPLKPDSGKAIEILKDSSHQVAMITGDNALTACQVAKELNIVTKPVLMLTKYDGESPRWITIDEEKSFSLGKNFAELSREYDFCLSGNTLVDFTENPDTKDHLDKVGVFARVNPDQKEVIVSNLKNHGRTVLMCGDGTNDVGALKQADIGVAVLNTEPPKAKRPARSALQSRNSALSAQRKPMTTAQRLADLQKQMDEADTGEVPMIQLGDASIASPFTSKGSSVMPTAHIIRQGRCTLVTTFQMFKILALNCLISAYSLSVLYLAGIKLGDTQATVSGMLIAMCFLFISRSQPLPTLSKRRPQSNLFSPYMILSIVGQFAVHLSCLVFVVNEVQKLSDGEKIDPDAEFVPNPVNSAVFLISCAMQVTTFAVNYQGHPFMQSLRENKALFYVLTGSGLATIMFALELMPEMNTSFQLVLFPAEFRNVLVMLILFDFGASYAIEKSLAKIFGVN